VRARQVERIHRVLPPNENHLVVAVDLYAIVAGTG
jgi:hypothetical protein